MTTTETSLGNEECAEAVTQTAKVEELVAKSQRHPGWGIVLERPLLRVSFSIGLADVDDSIVSRLLLLKQNLERRIFSNQRADALEKMDEDEFILDKERETHYAEENEKRVLNIKDHAQHLIDRLEHLR